MRATRGRREVGAGNRGHTDEGEKASKMRRRNKEKRFVPGYTGCEMKGKKKPYAALLNLHWIEIMARIKGEPPFAYRGARTTKRSRVFPRSLGPTIPPAGRRAHSPSHIRSSSFLSRDGRDVQSPPTRVLCLAKLAGYVRIHGAEETAG